MNPFSGKPFHFNYPDQLNKIDKRFRGFGIKYEYQNDCLVITSDTVATFSGSIFTNATCHQDDLKRMIRYPKVYDDYESDDEFERRTDK